MPQAFRLMPGLNFHVMRRFLMDRFKNLIPTFLVLFLALGSNFGVVKGAVNSEIQEFTVIGIAESGPDQVQVYREALENGLRKAFGLARQAEQNVSLLANSDREKDLVTLQKEIGIVDFRVLRYWTEQNQFRMELKVWVGDSETQTPRAGSLSRQPRVSWSRETLDRIESLSKYNLSLVVNTLQSLEIINPESGGLKRRIKTDFKPHLAYKDRYLVKNLEYLKVYSMDLINIYSFTDIWDRKLPELIKFSLVNDTLVIVEQTGTVRAFNWEDGHEMWQLPAITQVEIASGGNDRTLLIFPTAELWAVNTIGQKLWVKKLESALAAPPIVEKDELVCFLNDGQLKIFDAETGRSIASWKTDISGGLRQANLRLGSNEVYILYNDLSNRGHLHVYHRWTGRLLWKVDWEEAVIPKLIRISDAVVVGLSGTFEAREPLFGLKVWEERTIGRITGLYYNDPSLLVICGNRIYSYQL